MSTPASGRQRVWDTEDGTELSTIWRYGQARRSCWLADRLFMHAPTSAVFALACVVVGRLLMQDNRPFSADDATSWLSVACYLAAVVGSGLAIHVAVTAYVELNLCSQLAALVALDTCAHLVDLSLAPQTAAARIVLAAVAVSVGELAASAWQIRRAEVETIYRIKKVSMILGVVAACVTGIHVIRIFLDTGPS